MTTILVANRGEIARRIFRTARRMGLRTVAVHSTADAGAPFTREADAALEIGPAAARESYLSVERIVSAARDAGAELVHPGYGFLSEDPRLAVALADAGITFVGPSPAALAAFGSKAAAKAIAARAGAPLLPGYSGDDQTDEVMVAAAQTLGYPLIVKAAGGGGGIGMQVVRDAAVVHEALSRARRIALAAFGDEQLLLERYVDRPRHVEVQILADTHGNVIALGERDCSAQRRHQKVVEETPSPALDDARRGAISAAAVAIAREAAYTNAGTVEFIVDERGDHFFIEVNARLQVEHPVTEEVWGVDLVEQQIRIARGEAITLDAAPRGHAVEARVYAEDASAGFLPSSGTLLHVRWPEGVRVDAGAEEGSRVTTDYDPMLAKLIAHADDRAAALDALTRAVTETEVLGVRTNLSFLRSLLTSPEMRSGRMTTEHLDGWSAAPPATPPEAHAVAAAALVSRVDEQADGLDPWQALGGWRYGAVRSATVVLDDEPHAVVGAGPFIVGGRAVTADGDRAWTVDGRRAVARVAEGLIWVALGGETHEIRSGARDRTIDAAAADDIVAPMPGAVTQVHARAGARVERGELLFVLEAMKMELRVEAPAAGVVDAVLCRVGEQVRRGQRLAELTAA